MAMLRISVITGLALAVLACNRSTVCTIPEPANLWVQGSDRLNPNASGDPLPTLVRVYQLSNLGELEQASFEEMMQRPEEVLGETLLASEEVTVYPGRSTFRSFERDPGANYMAGVAVVRQPSGASWRTIITMPTCGKKAKERPMVRFVVDGYSIEGRIGRESDPEGCDHDDIGCLLDRSSGS
jgi:type VI secretion system protein VasD